jgi:hypothetical protein
MDFALDGVQWWSLLILEGYSRTILAGVMDPTEAVWAALMVLYTACVRSGAPTFLRGWTVDGHRLHPAVPRSGIGAKLQAKAGSAFGALPTARVVHRLHTGVKHDTSILCRADERVQPARNMLALGDIVAHMSDDTLVKY